MRSNEAKNCSTASGNTRYFDIGQGRPLILMHGFPDTPHTFEASVTAFGQAGYRCLIPYMPGYGGSDLPGGDDASLLSMAQQLDDWLAQVVPGESVALCGHDWGSILAQTLAGTHRQRETNPYHIDRVILAAVPPLRRFVRNINIRQIVRSRYMYYFQLPGVTRRIRQGDLAYIRTLWRRWSPGLPADHPQIERVAQQLQEPMILEQAVAYYRFLLNPAKLFFQSQWRAQFRILFSRKPLPALIIVGEQDDCIGPEMYVGGARDFPHPLSREVVLSQAGHFLHLEQPAAFHRAVLEFLEASPDAA